MPGIGYITVNSDLSFKGPIDKFLTDEDRKNLIDKAELKENSVLFFIADRKEKVAAKQAGMIRTELGKRLDLIDENVAQKCFLFMKKYIDTLTSRKTKIFDVLKKVAINS